MRDYVANMRRKGQSKFCGSVNHLVQRIFNDAFRAGGLELRNQFAHDLLVNDRLHGDPAFEAQIGNGRMGRTLFVTI